MTAASPAEPAGPAGHLLPLGDGGWGIWPAFCVRHAGMPYDWLATGPADPAGPTWQAAAERMRDRTAEPAFRVAVQWQNGPVAHRLRSGRPWKRDLARSVAGYLTRYCAKNDTIGFFGAAAWGEWSDAGTSAGPVPTAIDTCDVHLELWAVRRLAEVLHDRHDLAPWTVPHLAPVVGVDGAVAHLVDGSRLALTAEQRSVLAACDGRRTVVEVLGACPGLPPRAAQAQLTRLQAMGVLSRGFALSQSRHPEEQLRGQLRRVRHAARRAAALAELDEVVAAVRAARKAAGDPDDLEAALAALDDVFTRLTGTAAHHREGRYYAGRSVLYPDGPSTLSVRLGTRVLAEVAPALELLLTSARWFSRAVAAEYLALAGRIVDAGPTGDPAGGYPLTELLGAMADTFWAGPDRPVDAAAAELRRRWTGIVRPDASARCVTLGSAELRDRLLDVFAAPGPGWPTARWHSPDLMIAAHSAQDVEAGRYLAVLGELHPTINSTDQLCFLDSFADQDRVRGWIDADMAGRIVPLYPAGGEQVNSRTAPPEAYHSASYTYLGLGAEASYAPPGARSVPAGALRVHRDGGRLRVRSLLDDFEADLAAVLDDYLSTAAYSGFGLFQPQAHQPRVLIDKVVVARETWRVPFADLPEPEHRLDRVLAAVAGWARSLGLPRRVFAAIAGEAKPVYVDFGDPVLVDALWSKLRRGRERVPGGGATVTEMLPGPEDLWLRDARGRRYTAEFRIVCVDGAAAG